MPEPEDPKHPILERALIEARERIQVHRDELDEARSRRQRILNALVEEFHGRPYVNGSVAHGDALTPLTDVDLGIVIPDPLGEYGPGRRGPAEFQECAAAAIRRELAEDFPNLRITWKGRRRAVLVQFGDPVTPGQRDFTADVITALDNPNGAGLFIPDWDGWSRSAPETHTAMIVERNRVTHSAFARLMRLAKHWARTHDKPLCSWNIKALGLGVITTQVGMFDGLRAWFDHAIAELKVGPTEDPAHVAPEPIAIPEKWTIRQVVSELQKAATGLQRAARFEEEGYPALALDELARVFKDPVMLPGPDPTTLQAEVLKRARAGAAPGVLPATAPLTEPPPQRRAWGTR